MMQDQTAPESFLIEDKIESWDRFPELSNIPYHQELSNPLSFSIILVYYAILGPYSWTLTQYQQDL